MRDTILNWGIKYDVPNGPEWPRMAPEWPPNGPGIKYDVPNGPKYDVPNGPGTQYSIGELSMMSRMSRMSPNVPSMMSRMAEWGRGLGSWGKCGTGKCGTEMRDTILNWGIKYDVPNGHVPNGPWYRADAGLADVNPACACGEYVIYSPQGVRRICDTFTSQMFGRNSHGIMDGLRP